MNRETLIEWAMRELGKSREECEEYSTEQLSEMYAVVEEDD